MISVKSMIENEAMLRCDCYRMRDKTLFNVLKGIRFTFVIKLTKWSMRVYTDR